MSGYRIEAEHMDGRKFTVHVDTQTEGGAAHDFYSMWPVAIITRMEREK